MGKKKIENVGVGVGVLYIDLDLYSTRQHDGDNQSHKQ